MSGWQVYFSFQCYVGLAKLTQKFGSKSPIVNCNPGREEITLRKLFLHRLQRVLGTAAASGCQSQQMWDSHTESKPQIKLKRMETSSALAGPMHASLLIQNCQNCRYRWLYKPPKITENQVNKPEVNCFIYYHWAILWYAYPGFFQSKVGLFGTQWESEYFWSFRNSKITFQTSVSNVNRKQRPPEVYLYV